jgi:hypothetical protein
MAGIPVRQDVAALRWAVQHAGAVGFGEPARHRLDVSILSAAGASSTDVIDWTCRLSALSDETARG